MSTTPPVRMDELLRFAKDYQMTPEEREAQRQSWVRGEMGLDCDEATRTRRMAALPCYPPPESMPDLSPYMEDAKILTVMARSGLHEGVVPALLRIIDRRVAEIIADESFCRKPIIG